MLSGERSVALMAKSRTKQKENRKKNREEMISKTNSERYNNPTPFLAMKSISKKQAKEKKLVR